MTEFREAEFHIRRIIEPVLHSFAASMRVAFPLAKISVHIGLSSRYLLLGSVSVCHPNKGGDEAVALVVTLRMDGCEFYLNCDLTERDGYVICEMPEIVVDSELFDGLVNGVERFFEYALTLALKAAFEAGLQG